METGVQKDQPCNIIILGASGDLSRKKLLPALFSLYCNDMLPDEFRIIGYARSKLSDEEFRNRAMENLTCRYEPGGEHTPRCAQQMDEFLARCHYFTGQYDSVDDFKKCLTYINGLGSPEASRLFYMSIPPSVFVATAKSIRDSGMLEVPDGFWARAVIEKPFGRDSETSAELSYELAQVFKEEQTYRIDHYLGKEVIQNLLVLRFANLVFEPLWNYRYIDHVSIDFSEDIGTYGRAGYFDEYGIIRDVLQNHLIQIMALVAMEQPVNFNAQDIADEKVKLLRSVPPIQLEDAIVGQYIAGEVDGRKVPGYLDDPGVPDDSLTPTFVHARAHINNMRWTGVPFYLSAGKALNTRKTEIHIQFKARPYSIFTGQNPDCCNDLHIRVQPNEAIEMHLASKIPGLEMKMDQVKLDMLYQHTFDGVLPEAYERLLLEVIRGDRSLFIQEKELAVSWDIVTPLLKELEGSKVKPLPYEFGTSGPKRGWC